MSANECYSSCNSKYGAFDSTRLYCKKGCDSEDETLNECKKETCGKVCIKSELGEDEKLGSWSSFFARAPKDSDECFSACYHGCNFKEDEDD